MAEQQTVQMRRLFADLMHQQMTKNRDVIIISGDLGYKVWDNVRKDFPDRFINVGASEQAMMGIAVGLALEGKIPIVYSITTFLLYRPFETIRNYVNYEKISVKLVGSGRDKDYTHDGFSHWAEEDKKVMRILNNIKSHWPRDNKELIDLMDNFINDLSPWYINLKR